MATKVIHGGHVAGEREMKMTIPIINAMNDEYSRKGGFSPVQWVLGKLPRNPGSQFDEDSWANYGVLSSRFSADAAMARQMELRNQARLAFAEVDCSDRIQRSILRNAERISKDYKQGDLICYRKKAGS